MRVNEEWSVEVLSAFWSELLRKFEKEESEQIIDALNFVEGELRKRSGQSCN